MLLTCQHLCWVSSWLWSRYGTRQRAFSLQEHPQSTLFLGKTHSFLYMVFFNWSSQFSVPKWKAACSQTDLLFHDIPNLNKLFVGIFFFDTENGEEQIKRVGGCLTRLSSKNESKMQKYSLAFRKLPRVDAMTLPIGLPAGSLSPVEIGPNPKYRNWGKWNLKKASWLFYQIFNILRF